MFPLLVTLYLLVGCGHDHDHDHDSGEHDHGDESLPDDFDPTRTQETVNGLYTVVYAPDPDPIPDSALFSVTFTVNGAEATVTAVDASMPQHGGHGMNVAPAVIVNEDGTFTASPLEFHMPGYWIIHVDVDGPSGTERANFDVDCCE